MRCWWYSGQLGKVLAQLVGWYVDDVELGAIYPGFFDTPLLCCYLLHMYMNCVFWRGALRGKLLRGNANVLLVVVIMLVGFVVSLWWCVGLLCLVLMLWFYGCGVSVNKQISFVGSLLVFNK